MNNKCLVIGANLTESVKFTKTDKPNEYVFEGVFTVFDVKNKNNRIYEKKDFLPFVEKLQKKIKDNVLLGELDHPKDFDVLLNRASHVIQELKYDEATNCIKGKLRLLDNEKGKIAMSLIEAGVPLHVSSRASGNVNEGGRVKLESLITYDLVSDPGFEQARLKSVNETVENLENKYSIDKNVSSILLENIESQFNVGIGKFELLEESLQDSDVLVYKYINEEKTNTENMYVTPAELEKWSSKIISQINEVLKQKDNKIKDLENYISNLAENLNETGNHGSDEKLDNVIEWVNQIVKNCNTLAEHQDHISEKSNVLLEYVEHIANNANNLSEHVDHIAESGRTLSEHVDHVAESGQTLSQYTEKLSNDSNKLVEWVDDMIPKMNALWEHAEHVSENSNNLYELVEKHGEGSRILTNYIQEIVEKNNIVSSHVDNISETLEQLFGNSVNENFTGPSIKLLNESHSGSENSYKDSIADRLNSILEASEKEHSKIDPNSNPKLHFLNFLSKPKKDQFFSMDLNEKQSLVEEMEKNSYFDEGDILKIWENWEMGEREFNSLPGFVKMAPEKYRKIWNTLNENSKIELERQARMRNMLDESVMLNFWETRNFSNLLIENHKPADLPKNDIDHDKILNELRQMRGFSL